MTAQQEEVVLVDHAGAAVGTAPKLEVHTADTPLHRAFSCHILNSAGQVLLTRRALSKITWPGVWTNSLCGHPAPGEDTHDAVLRRARQELGASITGIRAALPDFWYRAEDASGIVEYEICPVFVAMLDGEISPSPDEVCEWAWVEPVQLIEAVQAAPFAFSPWLTMHVPEIEPFLTEQPRPEGAR